MSLISKLKAWWLRRFYGIVETAGSTRWHEHKKSDAMFPFTCPCGRALLFGNDNYFVVDHDEEGNATRARYVIVCVCGLGHWMPATLEVKK